jgi:hypothetical protein
VEDEASSRMLTYDNSVASVFQVPVLDARDVPVNYVGVIKNILKLDYGLLSSPVILLQCQWAKWTDNRGNPTYTRDDASFLVVNVEHNLPRMSDPLYFLAKRPKYFTQMFPINLDGRLYYEKKYVPRDK